jgi:hypothetical protein
MKSVQLEAHIARLKNIAATPGMRQAQPHVAAVYKRRDLARNSTGYKLRLLCSRRATLNRQMKRGYADIPTDQKPPLAEWSQWSPEECQQWFTERRLQLRLERNRIQRRIDQIIAHHPELGMYSNAGAVELKIQRWAENAKRKKQQNKEDWLQ